MWLASGECFAVVVEAHKHARTAFCFVALFKQCIGRRLCIRHSRLALSLAAIIHTYTYISPCFIFFCFSFCSTLHRSCSRARSTTVLRWTSGRSVSSSTSWYAVRCRSTVSLSHYTHFSQLVIFRWKKLKGTTLVTPVFSGVFNTWHHDSYVGN